MSLCYDGVEELLSGMTLWSFKGVLCVVVVSGRLCYSIKSNIFSLDREVGIKSLSDSVFGLSQVSSFGSFAGRACCVFIFRSFGAILVQQWCVWSVFACVALVDRHRAINYVKLSFLNIDFCDVKIVVGGYLEEGSSMVSDLEIIGDCFRSYFNSLCFCSGFYSWYDAAA